MIDEPNGEPSEITRALQDVARPEDIEPRGYVRLQSVTTGSIAVHIDELPRIRLAQSVDDPRTVRWLSLQSRSGGLVDVWWPDVREIEVRTIDSIAREHQINRAFEDAVTHGYDGEAGDDDDGDGDDGDEWKRLSKPVR